MVGKILWKTCFFVHRFLIRVLIFHDTKKQ